MGAAAAPTKGSLHWPAADFSRVPYKVFTAQDIYDAEQEQVCRGPSQRSPVLVTNIGNGLNLDEKFGPYQGRDLDQCRAWKIPAEEFAASLPYIGLKAHVRGVHCYLNDIIHLCAGSFDQRFDATEYVA